MPFATPENGWFKKAFFASTFFENSNTKAQVTGNFDGTALTCGFMGWIFTSGEQQKLVKMFDMKYPGLLKQYMPKSGDEYWHACQQLPSKGSGIVSRWSHGATVVEPYKSELVNFWNSPEMVEMQLTYAQATMGPFAELHTDRFCKHFAVPANINIYAMFFDVRVQNGSMKDVMIENVPNNRSILMSQANVGIKWMANRHSGAAQADVHRNAALWITMLQGSDDWRLALFGLGYLRSIECAEAWKGVCLDRKGTLAFGHGYVNGTHYVL